MGIVVGGIGSSHAPSIASAYDKGEQEAPLWKPLFDGYRPAKAWLGALKPDLVIAIYNDHMNRFFFDAYPTFAIGVGEDFPIADEGWGKRDFSAFKGNPEFGWHAAKSLIDDEFDMTVCQEMSIDHGILSIIPMLMDDPWPVPVLPIAVNVIQHPLPTARRLYRLGQGLRRAVESFGGDDFRVAVLGTGGLSHQLHGKRYGFMNPDWDNEFLDLIEADPARLAELSHDDYMRRGGAESVEMIMWLAMRGALPDAVARVTRNYHAPVLTGYGLLALEPR